MLSNGAGVLADGKPCVSMSLSQNGFAMLTRTAFFVFGLSINVAITLLTTWLLTLYAQSALHKPKSQPSNL